MADSGSDSENPAIPTPEPEPGRPRTNRDWWPNQLDLQVLHQHSPRSDPMGEGFDYAEVPGCLNSLPALVLRLNGTALSGSEPSEPASMITS